MSLLAYATGALLMNMLHFNITFATAFNAPCQLQQSPIDTQSHHTCNLCLIVADPTARYLCDTRITCWRPPAERTTAHQATSHGACLMSYSSSVATYVSVLAEAYSVSMVCCRSR